MSVRDPRDVLLAPVISEKSYGLLDSNQYTFIVLPEANKSHGQGLSQQWLSVSTSRRRRAAAAPASPTSPRSPATIPRSRWSGRCTAAVDATSTARSPLATRGAATSAPTV